MSRNINLKNIVKSMLIATTLLIIIAVLHPYANADYNDDGLYEAELETVLDAEIVEEIQEVNKKLHNLLMRLFHLIQMKKSSCKVKITVVHYLLLAATI